MKTVLITGVSKGIGKSLTEKFLSEGWAVLGTYHDVELSPKENLTLFPLDLNSTQSISECCAKIKNTNKRISILINNAGILADEEETTVMVDKLRVTLEVNLIGTIAFTESNLPILEESGHIINISSTAGSLERTLNGASGHYPNHYPAYKISKAALNMYTRTLAKRFKDKNFTVSSVHPGWVKTEMGGSEADISPEEAAKYIYEFALSHPETGGFWFKGEKVEW